MTRSKIVQKRFFSDATNRIVWFRFELLWRTFRLRIGIRGGATGRGMTMPNDAFASPVAELESSPSVGPLQYRGN